MKLRHLQKAKPRRLLLSSLAGLGPFLLKALRCVKCMLCKPNSSLRTLYWFALYVYKLYQVVGSWSVLAQSPKDLSQDVHFKGFQRQHAKDSYITALPVRIAVKLSLISCVTSGDLNHVEQCAYTSCTMHPACNALSESGSCLHRL